MEYLNLEEYTEGHSALHRLDPRIKLICAIASIFCIVFLTHWYLPLIFFAACFGLVLYSRASLKVYVKRLLIPISLIAFIGVIMPFTYGSTIIARVPLLATSYLSARHLLWRSCVHTLHFRCFSSKRAYSCNADYNGYGFVGMVPCTVSNHRYDDVNVQVHRYSLRREHSYV